MLSHGKQLEQWLAAGLLRQRQVVQTMQAPYLRIEGQDYIGFANNDYLGLASHPLLRQTVIEVLQQEGLGASASALVTGHSPWHELAEQKLAEFVELPKALLFSSGYMANVGVVSALLAKGDAVFVDRLCHASLLDGARLSGAQLRVYAHGNMQSLEKALAKSGAARKVVLSDSIFSMDGDIAPLAQLYALCQRYDATLVLDDAHGFGVLGNRGQGALGPWAGDARGLIYIGTLGKAAGLSGAFVAGHHDVIAYLQQKARTYMFSTASPPAWAAAICTSLDIIAQESWRREQLQLHAQLIQQAGQVGALPGLLPSSTPIQAIVVGDNHRTRAVAAQLKRKGFWVPAICPPTVPKASARLRISLSALHSKEQVQSLLTVLILTLQELSHEA